jgi:hypothetical protein
MTLVRIVKSWAKPDLLRQTPGSRGVWSDVTFTLDPVERCDWLVFLNHIPEPMVVEVPESNVLCFVQEPPLPVYQWMRKGFPHYHRVYLQDQSLQGSRFVHSHGSLPWHLDRSYDELKSAPFPEKRRSLSWITSNLALHRGHRRRLKFLSRLQSAGVAFDLFGRGFSPLADKWDGLAPYRYSIAVENESCPDYWTEKIADCFLAWTMPIYFGATNIADYFPRDSFVWLDIEDPEAPRKVAEIVASDLSERNRAAIAEARRRVLEEHNLFPRLSRLISSSSPASPARRIAFPHVPDLTAYYTENNFVKRSWNGLVRRLHVFN